jgi:hypothetical protein
MTWKKIVNGSRIDIYAKADLVHEITTWPKMWELVKLVGDRFGLIFNKQKFHPIKNVKCKLYEFKPNDQTRYFARIGENGLMIYHREIKKKDSLKISEYNIICDAFNLYGGGNG